jgi:peptidoglycan/LPS O-acetylase OafA/YrhL
MQPQKALYFPKLDNLRFFAFVLVFIHHAPYYHKSIIWKTISNFGWMGVDLFLCLSAFLFARLLLVEFQEFGDINVRYFYFRRALRIWPLYFFFFSVLLIISVLQSGWVSELWIRSIGMITFTDNLFTADMGYNTIILYSAHLWTISYEEQFYAVIPWILRKFYKIKSAKTIRILIVAILFGMLTRALFIYYGVTHPAIWVLPITHFESIFGGLILGLGLIDKILKKIPGWLELISGVLALWLITYLPNIGEIQWKLMLTYPLIGIGMSFILHAVLTAKLWPISFFLRNQVLSYLGKLSYGLYVYHFVGIKLAYTVSDYLVSPKRIIVYPTTVFITGLMITTLISILSYHLLEKPFLRLKERFSFIQTRPI